MSSHKPAIASGLAILAGMVLVILSGPGEYLALDSDPRALVCGNDCYPVANPWLLIAGAALAIAGLLGLRISLRKAR